MKEFPLVEIWTYRFFPLMSLFPYESLYLFSAGAIYWYSASIFDTHVTLHDDSTLGSRRVPLLWTKPSKFLPFVCLIW